MNKRKRLSFSEKLEIWIRDLKANKYKITILENHDDKKINLGGKKTTFIKVTIGLLLFISNRKALYSSFI